MDTCSVELDICIACCDIGVLLIPVWITFFWGILD